MEVHISPSWKSLLSEEFEKPYFKSLTDFVKKEYKEHTCYPKGKDIFAAFDQCPIDTTEKDKPMAYPSLSMKGLPTLLP